VQKQQLQELQRQTGSNSVDAIHKYLEVGVTPAGRSRSRSGEAQSIARFADGSAIASNTLSVDKANSSVAVTEAGCTSKGLTASGTSSHGGSITANLLRGVSHPLIQETQQRCKAKK